MKTRKKKETGSPIVNIYCIIYILDAGDGWLCRAAIIRIIIIMFIMIRLRCLGCRICLSVLRYNDIYNLYTNAFTAWRTVPLKFSPFFFLSSLRRGAPRQKLERQICIEITIVAAYHMAGRGLSLY